MSGEQKPTGLGRRQAPRRNANLYGNATRPAAKSHSGGSQRTATKKRTQKPKETEPYIELAHDIHAPDLHVLEQALSYRFRHKDLLLRALTHSTYAHGQTVHGTPMQSNERLEFLGDRILSFVVDKFLFQKHPDLMEGDLTQLHSFAVANETLAGYASQLQLSKHLRIARGTRVTGTKIPADAFEALIAAMYLDRQKLAHVEKFILRFVEPLIKQQRQEIDWQHLVKDVEKTHPSRK